jgi:hypothetical protein
MQSLKMQRNFIYVIYRVRSYSFREISAIDEKKVYCGEIGSLGAFTGKKRFVDCFQGLSLFLVVLLMTRKILTMPKFMRGKISFLSVCDRT